ncbi:chitinase 10-like [Fagus crenata]
MAFSVSYSLAFLSLIFLFSSTIFLSFASWGTEALRLMGNPSSSISSLISKDLFDIIFLFKDSKACPAKNFYTYNSFITASEGFPNFGTIGSLTERKHEIASFLA